MAEKEYIERGTALKIIDNYGKTVSEEGLVIVNAIRDIVGVICPAADVEPVKSGEWLIRNNADYLLENGVIVPPVKVGDTVWDNDFGCPESYTVTGFDMGKTMDDEIEHSELFVYCQNWNGSITFCFPVSTFGKAVFLTREEAEKALKEREENAETPKT